MIERGLEMKTVKITNMWYLSDTMCCDTYPTMADFQVLRITRLHAYNKTYTS